VTEGAAAVSFEALRARFEITPIRGCPGRFLLRGAMERSVEALVGGATAVEHHRSERARDPVIVARFPGGGLISYRHPDGTYLHTLCDEGGLARKLAQLGIERGGG
jgi:hypothetical protein